MPINFGSHSCNNFIDFPSSAPMRSTFSHCERKELHRRVTSRTLIVKKTQNPLNTCQHIEITTITCAPSRPEQGPATPHRRRRSGQRGHRWNIWICRLLFNARVKPRDAPAVCTSRSVAKEAVVGFQDKPSESPWRREKTKTKTNSLLCVYSFPFAAFHLFNLLPLSNF